MRTRIITILFMFLASISVAVTYPVVTWVCTNKNAIKINSDGSLTVNFVAQSSKAPVLIGYPSVTLISTNTYKVNISSDGSVNLATK